MKATILATATALVLGASVASAQDDASMGQGFNMLTGAVYNALNAQGFDTENINNLTLSEIATIRRLLTEDMGSSERQRIEKILDDAAG
ncbi:MAG: hypothetical protein AAGG09_08485 [Pseudomonadota bacterium]